MVTHRCLSCFACQLVRAVVSLVGGRRAKVDRLVLVGCGQTDNNGAGVGGSLLVVRGPKCCVVSLRRRAKTGVEDSSLVRKRNCCLVEVVGLWSGLTGEDG